MRKLILISVFFFAPFWVGAQTVAVVIDTGSETINAVSGTLSIPTGATIEEIFTGESAILIWVTPPTLSTDGRILSFAGLSPGGFKGKFPLFSLSGSNLEDLSNIHFVSADAYRNDGEGTRVAAHLSFGPSVMKPDEVPPEVFSLNVSASPEIFEGKHFLTFTTQDKITGVLRYEYLSTWLLTPDKEAKWVEVVSPLPLSNIELFKRLHVRALDHEGNFRAVSTPGPYWPLTLVFGLIIIVCLALFLTRFLALPSSFSSSSSH